MDKFSIKHTGSCICFVSPFMFKLSRVTWNHWIALDDVYGHKWCPSETCVYMFYKEICITLSRDKSLTSNNAIRFGSTLMPQFPHDSGGILKYTDNLHYL